MAIRPATHNRQSAAAAHRIRRTHRELAGLVSRHDEHLDIARARPGLHGNRSSRGRSHSPSQGHRRATATAWRAAIAPVSASGAVPDDRDCSRGGHGRWRSRGCLCPKAAVRAMSARLLLLCLLFRSSWLTNGGGRPAGCCIAGADGQSWPCRSAWLLAFQSRRVVRDAARCRFSRERRCSTSLLPLGDRSSARFGGRRRSSPPWDQHRRPARTTASIRALARRLQARDARLWR
jgi:hypothetical protein